jgi:hypothetical protein
MCKKESLNVMDVNIFVLIKSGAEIDDMKSP